VQIGLAVATMLAFASVALTVLEVDRTTQRLEGGDLTVWSAAEPGLDASVQELIESDPNVTMAHPMIYSSVELDGERNVWGLPAVSTYDPDIVAGRWFTEDEAQASAKVAVMGRALSTLTGSTVGEVVTVETRRGPIDLEIIGLDGRMVNNGQGIFAPFETVMAYEGWTTSNYWVRTAQPDAATVDAAAAGIQNTLEAAGYTVGSNLRYIDRNQSEAQNRLIVVVIMAMGLPIVAIGMIGFVNAMTTSILERTREIGVLRSIGARRRDLRAMFRAEGVAVAATGWLIGIPAGYVLGRFIVWVIANEFNAPFDFVYPLWPIVGALAVTLLVAVMVLRLPVRRAVRMRPGLALRYE
jgi:putative ABC transport system permease protein